MHACRPVQRQMAIYLAKDRHATQQLPLQRRYYNDSQHASSGITSPAVVTSDTAADEQSAYCQPISSSAGLHQQPLHAPMMSLPCSASIATAVPVWLCCSCYSRMPGHTPQTVPLHKYPKTYP
jgi:hypothetical protein